MKRRFDAKLCEQYLNTYPLHNYFESPMADHFSILEFDAHETIIESGQNLTAFYWLVEGRIKVTYPFENGKYMAVKYYHPLASIGDIEFHRGIPALCDVTALTPVTFLSISSERLRASYNTDVKFMHYLIDSLSHKLYATVANNAYNATYPLQNRLASYLVNEPIYINRIVLNATLTDIADFLGTTYRHLSRTLKALEAEGILSQQDGVVIILDRDRLEALNKSPFIGTT